MGLDTSQLYLFSTYTDRKFTQNSQSPHRPKVFCWISWHVVWLSSRGLPIFPTWGLLVYYRYILLCLLDFDAIAKSRVASGGRRDCLSCVNKGW